METMADQTNKQMQLETIDVSMFGEASGLADVTLIVDSVRIPVVKALLSLSSPVFREMFQGKWKEKNQNEINLPEKTLDTFVPFLRCLYPDLKERVTGENAAFTLPLASEYQVVKLMEQCEDSLLTFIEDSAQNDMACDELCKYLKLAEQFERKRLCELCIIRMSRFPLNIRKLCLNEYSISAQSQCQIAETSCKRHELYEIDLNVLIKLFPNKDIVEKIENHSSGYCSGFKEAFQSVRLSRYMYGIDSHIYRDMLIRLQEKCKKCPKDIPAYNEFEYLPEDLKYDLQRIIPGFRK